jgi:hypothetical protein
MASRKAHLQTDGFAQQLFTDSLFYIGDFGVVAGIATHTMQIFFGVRALCGYNMEH